MGEERREEEAVESEEVVDSEEVVESLRGYTLMMSCKVPFC